MRGRERLRALKKGPQSARIRGRGVQCQLRLHPVWPPCGHGAGPPCGVAGALLPPPPPPRGGRTRLRTSAPRTRAPGASWVLARPGVPSLFCAPLDRGAPGDADQGVIGRSLSGFGERPIRGPIRKVPPALPSFPPAAPALPPAAGGVSGRDYHLAPRPPRCRHCTPWSPQASQRVGAVRCSGHGTPCPPRAFSFPVHPARSPAITEVARQRSPAAG